MLQLKLGYMNEYGESRVVRKILRERRMVEAFTNAISFVSQERKGWEEARREWSEGSKKG